MNALSQKKPSDLQPGDEVVFLQSRAMGAEFEVRVARVAETQWDDGDLFVRFVGQQFQHWQLRGRELYEPVLVIGAAL